MSRACVRCEMETVTAGRVNCDDCVADLLDAGERVHGRRRSPVLMVPDWTRSTAVRTCPHSAERCCQSEPCHGPCDVATCPVCNE